MYQTSYTYKDEQGISRNITYGETFIQAAQEGVTLNFCKYIVFCPLLI